MLSRFKRSRVLPTARFFVVGTRSFPDRTGVLERQIRTVCAVPEPIFPIAFSGKNGKIASSRTRRDGCGVFLSLISDTSALRLTAYNILERNLASKRRDRFADSEVFYIPLRIDEGEPLVPANEPRGTKKTQAVRKSGGHLDDGFIEYLRQLQLEYIKRCGLTSTSSPLSP